MPANKDPTIEQVGVVQNTRSKYDKLSWRPPGFLWSVDRGKNSTLAAFGRLETCTGRQIIFRLFLKKKKPLGPLQLYIIIWESAASGCHLLITGNHNILKHAVNMHTWRPYLVHHSICSTYFPSPYRRDHIANSTQEVRSHLEGSFVKLLVNCYKEEAPTLPCLLSKSDSAKGQVSGCKWKESEFLDMSSYSCKDHMGPSRTQMAVTIRSKQVVIG